MTGSERRVRAGRLAWPYLAAHRWRVMVLAASSLLGGIVEATLLVVVARTALALADGADVVEVGPERFSVGTLLVIALALPLLRVTLATVAAWQTATLTTRAMADIRRRLFRAALEASWAMQSRDRLGHLQELLTTSAYQVLLALRAVATGLGASLTLLALLAGAVAVSLGASLAVGAAVLVLTMLLYPLRSSVQRLSRSAALSSAEFATSLTEHTTMAREIRVFGVEEPVASTLERSIEDHRGALARAGFVDQLAPVGYQSLVLLLVVVTLVVVHLSGSAELAALAAVVLIMVRSASYSQAIQVAIQALHQATPYLEAIERQATGYEAAAVARAGEPVGDVDDVAFDGVSFAYQAGPPVLGDVSFRVGRGELIGIVGPTGSGKSTLVQLLLRLREPTAGRITVGGRDIRSLSLDEWYQRVAYAPQEAVLLTGSVLENIAFFRTVERSAVERAARLAHLHDDIVTWPDGYDTTVGERGAQLSGGQRQRICLARAMLGDPDVLVFDEPTSSLDARSEALFREALEARATDATVFVVAHRMSTLRSCNRIMVLHETALEHFDEPDALEQSNPFFRDVLRLSGLRPS